MRVEDGERVREVLGRHLSAYRVERVERLGEGQDNVAFEVNGELVVRFAKEPDAEEAEREARLLARVAEISPIPVPTPVFSVTEIGCVAYWKVPGRQLLGLPGAPVAEIGATLGGYLAVLNAVPLERMADVVGVDDDPPSRWLAEAAELYVPETVLTVHRGPVEEFLATEPPPARPGLVFSHNDLGVEHVLVDPRTWTVTGVIDWTDAAFTDPAYDLGLLYRDLGPAAFEAALAAYGDDEPRERAVFLARCTVLEDLEYGIRSGKRVYAENALASMEWLFC
ncbi:phosphotransferase family protein [Umezawaea endophytica]|uniref:Aminoglycoside phosphotransferase family protein n=1 Tax=Umezawaea endophytica TaxID=1654476 RepID=A0A9X2VV13_9PSEU|nr:aminoglycoside phosphotransferase family protein [Umezawaea endophytica]MCS7483169.1 aminoglycoside phosphotransferase family protein [Umezawaea endophytica]